MRIASYTIQNGSLIAGIVGINSDATVTVSPGNGGINHKVLAIAELNPV
jgi:hypothetical protein